MAKQGSHSPGALRLPLGLLKLACILAGLPLTVLCLMSLVGLFTANGWARLLVGVLGGTLLPILIVDRILPADEQKAHGLVTDLLSIIFVGVPLVFVALGTGFSGRALAVEGDRLTAAGWRKTGGLAYWLAGVRTEGAPLPSGGTQPGTAAGGGKGTGAAAPRADAGPPRDLGQKTAAARAPDAGRSKLTPAEIFQRFAASVVFIKRGSGGGTGFILDDKGLTATNSHVIHDATDVEVKLKDGTIVREVELLAEDEKADLALLAVKLPKPVRAVVLGDSEAVVVGEPAVAIGNPLGLEHTLTDGLISSRRVFEGRRWLQISVPLSPGNSGGPLFNLYGEVVGVNTGTVAPLMAQNLNLAVPVSELQKMIKPSYPGRKSVGAAAGTATGTW